MKARVASLVAAVLTLSPEVGEASGPWHFARPWRDGVDASDREDMAAAHSLREAAGDLTLVTLPMAGLPGRDTFIYNYVDLDPVPSAILDWDCTGYTYDGHQGHDVAIRSFREQAIGVPVFAAAPGVVTQAVDHHPDDSTDTRPKPANHVTIDHGGGWIGYYYHVKNGSAIVAAGGEVAAGQQIASVGSSGISTGPHLHLELRRNGIATEPSAGSCRSGDSLWSDQLPVTRNLYASEIYFSLQPIDFDGTDEGFWRAIMLEERSRVGGLARGPKPVHFWANLQNLPPGLDYRARLLDPRGRLRQEFSGPFGTEELYRWAYGEFLFEQDWEIAGDWRVELFVGSQKLVDARLTVTRGPRPPKNRPPSPIQVALGATQADATRPTVCRITQDLLREDRDFDLVSYRYEWSVNGRAVRTTHSAALSDLLPSGAATASDQVLCSVRPFDGKVFGKRVSARTR